ncbi:GTPase-activating of the rho rac family (LRG1) [Fusarium mundagurra]|uniref:GTPase-activating of the rho rac family (LRG1) n=1 Tax=Fusarium mundagurra TaxID=1567541 RepID=A0A8H5YL38_9HYPO|nr:GTPase-activating of the rho rac family (LRG1) [Fusarium mundagurra]
MDPLSIASSVVGLTATCLSTCKKLHDLAGEYQDVPAVIAMICSESTIISIGLSELQMKILRRDDLAQAWASKTEIWTAFETALTGCMVVFSCLEAETRSLRSKNPGVWAKIKFIWNQDRLKELLGALRAQQSSITFLLGLLELLFHLKAVSGNAPSELDFEFDNLVINSQAYRRAFIKAQSESLPPQIEDVDSVKELDLSRENGISYAKDLVPPPFQKQMSGNWTELQIIQPVLLSGNTHCYGCPWGTTKDYLRALGKTWHVGCFKCSDVHCFKCQQPILGDFEIALGRRYHPIHFTCDRCEIVFSKGIDYYQRNGDIYCLLHFCREAAYYCHACKFPITGRYSERDGEESKWHTVCFELSTWGLVLPVSAHGHRYLDSIQDQSLKALSSFDHKLHDDRAKDILFCGLRYMKEFQDCVTQYFSLTRGGPREETYAAFKVILAMLSCLFKTAAKAKTNRAGEQLIKTWVNGYQSDSHPYSKYPLSSTILSAPCTRQIRSNWKIVTESWLPTLLENAGNVPAVLTLSRDVALLSVRLRIGNCMRVVTQRLPVSIKHRRVV